jgi:hypothetical protein
MPIISLCLLELPLLKTLLSQLMLAFGYIRLAIDEQGFAIGYLSFILGRFGLASGLLSFEQALKMELQALFITTPGFAPEIPPVTEFAFSQSDPCLAGLAKTNVIPFYLLEQLNTKIKVIVVEVFIE